MDSRVDQGLKEVRFAFRRDATPRTAGAITAVGGGFTIADTATTAKVGDIYRPETATTAAMVDKEYKITAVTTNSFTIASKEAPTNGDTFYILAYVTPKVDEKGVISVSATQGPTQFVLNGSDVEVLQDTATPSNSRPLPTILLDAGGNRVDPDTFATLAQQITQTNLVNSIDALLSYVANTQGDPADTEALQVGGVDGTGDFNRLGVDTSGAASSNLTKVAGTAVSVNSGNLDNGTQRVVLASNQPAVPTNIQQIKGSAIDSGSGAQTAATQRVILASDQTPIPATQSGTWNIATVTTVSTITNPVSIAANSSVNVNQIAGTATSVNNGNADTGTQRVTIAANSTGAIKQGGKSAINKALLDYTSTPVTSGAWVQLLASTTSAVSEIEIFDSSGVILELGTGAAASEVSQIYIVPGGNGRVPLTIATSTRVAVRAFSTTASVGNIVVNFYG